MKKLRNLICGLLSAAIMLTGAVFSASAAGTKDPRIIVSIGDSYSSGEGIPPFGNGTTAEEKVNDPDWLAHRSTLAWGGQLKLSGVSGTMSAHRGTNWFFSAASGAEIKHLTAEQVKEYIYGDYSGATALKPQLEVFDGITPGTVDYVTLTLGGNDFGFAKIMEISILHPDELDSLLTSIWKQYKKQIRSELKQAYKDIESKAGKQASIIVAGYPRLFNEKGFKVSYIFGSMKVKAKTVKKVNEATDKLNAEISGIVDECRAEGMNIWFASVADEFAGHEAYTDDPYINGVVMGRQAEDIIGEAAGISAYSIHPNEKGAKAYAKAVQKVIDKLESEKSSVSAVPTLTATAKTGKITLKWAAVSGATKYRVKLYTNGAYKTLKTTTKTSLSVSDVKSGTKYKYAVQAYVNGKWTAIEKAATATVKA